MVRRKNDQDDEGKQEKKSERRKQRVIDREPKIWVEGTISNAWTYYYMFGMMGKIKLKCKRTLMKGE